MEVEEEGDKDNDDFLNQNKRDGVLFFHENSSLIHLVPIDYPEIFNFYLYWLKKESCQLLQL